MKEVRISLTGWADSLSDYAEVRFILQIVFFEILGDCDWEFEIATDSESAFVYDPWSFRVMARRCFSRGFDKDKETRGYTVYDLRFVADNYTKEEIYLKSKEALMAKIKESTK